MFLSSGTALATMPATAAGRGRTKNAEQATITNTSETSTQNNLAAIEQVVMDFTMESLPQAPPVPVLEPHKMEVESMNPSNPENAVVEETASDSNPIPDNIVEAEETNNAEPDNSEEAPDLNKRPKPKIDLMDAKGPNSIENISD